jgi:hypothetical protein
MTSPPLARLPEEIRRQNLHLLSINKTDGGKEELIGINAIAECKILGDVSHATLMAWRIGYDLPIRKVSGIFVSSRAELQEWKTQHRDLTDAPNIMCKIEKNPARAWRWGFL